MPARKRRVLTPEEAEKELLRRHLEDRDWRLSNLYQIVDKKGRAVTFKPRWFYDQLRHGLAHRNIVLKDRQLGVTTQYCVMELDHALFTRDVKIGIIAHTKGDAMKIFREKIAYPYDHLPEDVRAAIPVVKRTEHEIHFNNGSQISVDVSYRGGTLQVLHVTEFGYTCAHLPARAEEVITGAFPAVPDDGIIIVESTAKGRAGHFHQMCQEAQKGNEWAFSFLPWHLDPECVDAGVLELVGSDGAITRTVTPFAERREPETQYLDKLQLLLGRTLSAAQRRWWCMKYRTLGDKVYSEYPSTPEEAFQASTEGAYYQKQMLEAWRSGRVTTVPVERGLPVETWWDLGMRDATAIWFVQRMGMQIRLVHYYQNSGEGFAHYAEYLAKWKDANKIVYSRAIGPHDLRVRELMGDGNSRLEVAKSKYGIHFEIAPELPIVDGIERVRQALGFCIFDEAQCHDGITGLESYRKEWDEAMGVWKDRPLHDWAEHPASAFRYGILAGNPMPMVADTTTKTAARPIVQVAWK